MADLGRILKSTVMAAIFAAPAYAQECGRLFPNIDAAYQEALTGNLADAEQVLRVLSSGSNPEELMEIASVARRGLPAVGPLRKPNPQLAMLALEQAIRIDGAHRPRALFLLAELGRETGQMTPERQDELIRLGGLLGNDKALIEIAREIMDSNQTVGPASGSNMLSVLIDGGLRLRSPEIAELAVEILDRGDIPLNLIPTREQLVATVIDILTEEFQGGRVGAATDLANLYLEDKLVPVDLEQATYWAEQTEGCREAREWRLMAEIAFLTEPDRSALVAEYYRRAAELGDVGGALELARLRTRGVSSEVSEDEALLWLERAIKIGSLAAMLERTRGGIERALPPYDSPVMEAAVTQAARDWNGDAR
ncbi:MAG TPA: hypothetical protein VLA51_13425, partial [Paracoccaceae bacterium]|nr:hypothetical protein [Paracoccaceae bacterium]